MIPNPCKFIWAFRNNLVTTVTRHAVYIEVLKCIVNSRCSVFLKIVLRHNATSLTLYCECIKNCCYYMYGFVARVCIEQIFDESCFANGCDVDLVSQPAVDIAVVDDVFQRNYTLSP